MNPFLSLLLRAVLFCAATPVTFLPRSLEVRLGRGLGRFMLAVDWKRKKIALANMARCLPELDAAGRQKLLADNYSHYGILFLELLHYFSPFPNHYRAYARRITALEGYELWKAAHDRGQGVIFISGHLANWEMMVAAGGLRGMKVNLVTRHLKPEWLHKHIEARRLSVGCRGIYQPRTLPALLKALRRGEDIGFAIDQYMPPPMGSPAPFFGTVVDSLTAIGPLAQRTGAAIMPVAQIREADGFVHIVIFPELDLGEDRADPSRAATRLNGVIEGLIRKNPAQWLWVHRRFKNLKVLT